MVVPGFVFTSLRKKKDTLTEITMRRKKIYFETCDEF